MLVYSQLLGLEGLGSDLAAILEEKDPLEPRNGVDINLRIEGLRRYRAGNSANFNFKKIEQVAKAYRQILGIKAGNSAVDPYATGLLIAQAFPERIAKASHQAQFKLSNGKLARIDKNDFMASEEWVAIAQMDERDGLGKIFLAAPLEPKDIQPLVKSEERIYWDEESASIQAVEERRIGLIVLEKKRLKTLTLN